MLTTERNHKRKLRKIWLQRPFYLMMLPGIIYYVIYRYMPIIGSVIAFKDYKLKLGIWGSPWANPWYKHILFFFKSPYFTQLMSNTLIISFLKMILGIPFAIFLALLLYEARNRHLKKAVQTLTYMPHFLSWVIVYGMCMILLSETNGLINGIFHRLFGFKIAFLTDPQIFRGLILGSDIWKNTGWNAIIYLAAMMGIDPTLYEAAHMDGASRIKCIRHITLPSIRNVIIILMIINCGKILNAGFDQIYIMYNPQVYSTTDIIDTWVFRTGIENFNISLASAVGLFKSAISFILVISVNKIAARWEAELW